VEERERERGRKRATERSKQQHVKNIPKLDPSVSCCEEEREIVRIDGHR
jgi:hypothetical protein